MAINSSKPEGGRTFGGGLFRSGAKKQQEELDWLRNHDLHSSLPNMNMLEQDFSNLQQREQWAFALVHINGFNRVNSIFGLDVGGRTVQRICPILARFAGEVNGQVYRASIGRLAVLAPAPDRDAFLTGLTDTLREMAAVQVEDDHTVYSYHYDFAYSVYYLSDQPEDFQELGALLSFCDNAARQERKEEVSVSGSACDLTTRPGWAKQDSILPDVRLSWENMEFEPCYQPVYALNSNTPVGAELLLRWRHPQRGLIPPADFLPKMEAAGLMMDMDLYMLDAACKKIKGWMDAELITVPLSINICKQNIHRADFLPHIIEIVTSYGIPPELIELELSESAIIFEKSDAFLFMMEQLQRIGFRLTMDDCAGSEVSSISLLRNLPIDTIKINRRFLKGVEESDRDRIFVTNILRMAKELGVKAIAMGIENQEQAATWLKLGCTYGQGFYLSPPLFNDEFEKLIF